MVYMVDDRIANRRNKINNDVLIEQTVARVFVDSSLIELRVKRITSASRIHYLGNTAEVHGVFYWH